MNTTNQDKTKKQESSGLSKDELNKKFIQKLKKIIETHNLDISTIGEKYEKFLGYLLSEKNISEKEYNYIIEQDDIKKGLIKSILAISLNSQKTTHSGVGENTQNQSKNQSNSSPLPSSQQQQSTITKTYHEILKMIENGDNIYKKIKGNEVSRESNILYTHVQLFRFIESGASDMTLRTRKTSDGKIYFQLIFKINDKIEVQDEAKPELIPSGDINKEEEELNDVNNFFRSVQYSKKDLEENEFDENKFFKKVRTYLGSHLSKMNMESQYYVQDGSFSLNYKGRKRDFRVNIEPTRCFGIPYPSMTLRLTSEANEISFEKVKMLPFLKNQFLEMIENKVVGAILLTGPTGSGKTTTIYSMLKKMVEKNLRIMSIENPIESQVSGVEQTQHDSFVKEDKNQEHINSTFLKGVLRQALDVIFIGELRTENDVQDGIRTGLIGNKLISTLHTNSASDTFLRLSNSGLDANTVANGIKWITSQRLIGTLCSHCSLKYSEEDKKSELDKINRYFKYPHKNLLNKLFDSLDKVKEINKDGDKNITSNNKEEEFYNNIDNLYYHFIDNLDFIPKKEVEEIIERISKNKEYLSSTIDNKKEIIKNVVREYPNKSVYEEYTNRLKNISLKKPNPNGCEHCKNGYKSQILICEALYLDENLRMKIQDPNFQIIKLKKHLVEERGFCTMLGYGYLLAMSGEICTKDLLSSVE